MSGPLLLFVVTEDWYFLSHRLGLARAAREAGFRVAVATRVREGGAAIAAEGFALHPLSWKRGERGVLALARAVYELTSLYRSLRPDLVHHIALLPMVVGGVAARLAGVPRAVGTLAGTGFLGVRNDAATALALRVLRALSTGRRRGVIVQNDDDCALLLRHGFSPNAVALVPGSGVDTAHYQPLPPPNGDFTIGVVSRFLRFKGIADIVEAQQILRRDGHAVRLLLAGAPDDDNPMSHSAVEVDAWARLPGVEYRGRVSDARTVWAQAHVAALASHGGEGVPLTLLEAAACGRALVATDVPGCRDVAIDGETGLLVPPHDPPALARAFQRLAEDAALCERLGAGARRLAEERFALDAIAAQTLALYRQILGA